MRKLLKIIQSEKDCLAKHLLHLFKKALLIFIRIRFEIGRMPHFLQHGSFFVTYVLRCPYIYVNKLVAFFIAVYCRKTFAFQPENFSALRTSRNFYFGSSIYGRYF